MACLINKTQAVLQKISKMPKRSSRSGSQAITDHRSVIRAPTGLFRGKNGPFCDHHKDKDRTDG